MEISREIKVWKCPRNGNICLSECRKELRTGSPKAGKSDMVKKILSLNMDDGIEQNRP